ncbi:MvaI/BcnI family restriction endonuclease [Ligilactobacillus equi]
MLFIPYDDELRVINRIHKFNQNSYTIIRLTETMLNKSIIDANVFFQDLLANHHILNYDTLDNSEKVKLKVKLILDDSEYITTMSCYRANKRGDKRFWLYNLGKFMKTSKVNTNDLLYITVNTVDKPEVTIFNLTNSIPSDSIISKLFGQDELTASLNRLLPQIKAIAKQGYHNNSKGPGKSSPKDAGDTLETLLGIEANNRKNADFEGLVELKTKTTRTLDTLFTLRPQFDGTPVSLFEANDRKRVSAFQRMYGYESSKHPGSKSLYITIGSQENPQNNHGFYLEVNDTDRIVELRKRSQSGSILTAYWTFQDLEKELQQKHPATLWVSADKKENGNMVQFKYTQLELTRSPQFMTFISLIKNGVITYDWRGYTTPSGKYSGKNHGNAWRIKNKFRSQLFGSSEIIDLNS